MEFKSLITAWIYKVFGHFLIAKLNPKAVKEKWILKAIGTIDLLNCFIIVEDKTYLPTDIYVPAFENIEEDEIKILRNMSLS